MIFVLAEDIQLQLRWKFSDFRSYQKIHINHALNSIVQISGTPNIHCNFKRSKMGKTWKFITRYSKQSKTNSLATKRTQKENIKWNTLLQEQRKHKRNKNTGLPTVRHFLYSHIARLHTLFVGEMMLCFLIIPFTLFEVIYDNKMPRSHGMIIPINVSNTLKHNSTHHKVCHK
jgi:hypothetical protein